MSKFVYLVWDSCNYSAPLGVFETEKEARDFLLGFAQKHDGEGYQHIYRLPIGVDVSTENTQICSLADCETSFLR